MVTTAENLKLGGKYWDLFEKRAEETVAAVRENSRPPLRRLSLHITNRCNMNCSYCNEHHTAAEMKFPMFNKMVKEYSDMGGGVLHITGGEPTVVKFFDEIFPCVAEYSNIELHVNTNCLKQLTLEQYRSIKRLKVSLDTTDAEYFNKITQVKNAFERVTANLDYIHDNVVVPFGTPTVSLTYTVTRQNYKEIPNFLRMYYKRWPKFYAVFFSSYKGVGNDFLLDREEINELFTEIVPQLRALTEENNDAETKVLFDTAHDVETFDPRIRFPVNAELPCWIQLSEIAINEAGEVWNCSHLLRDKVPNTGLNIADGHLADIVSAAKDQFSVPLSKECLFGCNRKLQTFNKYVNDRLVEITVDK